MHVAMKRIALIALVGLVTTSCKSSSNDARQRLAGGPTASPGAPKSPTPGPQPPGTPAPGVGGGAPSGVTLPGGALAPAPTSPGAAPAATQGGTTVVSPSGQGQSATPSDGAAPSGGTSTNEGTGGSTDQGAGAPAPGGQQTTNDLGPPGDQTGITGDQITVCLHLPTSGAVGALVGNDWKGMGAYFEKANEEGGFSGRKVKLVLADDQYSAQGAAGAARVCVDQNNSFVVAGTAGVDQLVVVAEYCNERSIPYVASGMSETFPRDKPWVFAMTTSYPYGATRLVDFMFQRKGYTPQRKIGALYLNSVHITSDMVPAMKEALGRYGSKFAEEVPAEKDQNDFSAGIIKLQNAGVDTVWFHVDPTLIAKFTAQAKALRFTPQYVFTSPAGGDLYAKAAGGNLDGAFGLGSFDQPGWPEAKPVVDEIKKYYSDYDPDEFAILTWAVADTVAEGFRRTGRTLGRDSFVRALNSIDNLNTGV